MAADDSTNPVGSDVENIRKILFGDQVNQIEERFSQNETAIAQLRSENRNLRQALEAELSQREKSIEDLQQRILALQKTLEEKIHEVQAAGASALKTAEDAHAAHNERQRAAQEHLVATITQAFDRFLQESWPGDDDV